MDTLHRGHSLPHRVEFFWGEEIKWMVILVAVGAGELCRQSLSVMTVFVILKFIDRKKDL